MKHLHGRDDQFFTHILWSLRQELIHKFIQIVENSDLKKFQTITFMAIIMPFLLTSCRGQVIQEHLPNRDIVFQFDNVAKDGPDKIGFINADGSGVISIESTPYTFLEPQWAGTDNNCLLVRHAQGFLSCLDKTGTLSKIRPKESLGDVSPIPDKNEAFIVRASDEHSGNALHRISLVTGDFIQTFSSKDNWLIDIGTNTQTDNLIVYSRTRYDEKNKPRETELITLNTVTMSEKVLLHYDIKDPVTEASILNPTISPDGRWIAYTVADGLHLIHPDGSGDMQLVNIPDWNAGWPVFTWAPRASWSPDSQWIVYHKCLNEGCMIANHRGRKIYKINIETRENKLLVNDGINPYWKLAH